MYVDCRQICELSPFYCERRVTRSPSKFYFAARTDLGNCPHSLSHQLRISCIYFKAYFCAPFFNIISMSQSEVGISDCRAVFIRRSMDSRTKRRLLEAFIHSGYKWAIPWGLIQSLCWHISDLYETCTGEFYTLTLLLVSVFSGVVMIAGKLQPCTFRESPVRDNSKRENSNFLGYINAFFERTIFVKELKLSRSTLPPVFYKLPVKTGPSLQPSLIDRVPK